MPRRSVSRDLKACIPYLAYVEGFKIKEIGRILGVKKSMIQYQTLNYYRMSSSSFGSHPSSTGYSISAATAQGWCPARASIVLTNDGTEIY